MAPHGAVRLLSRLAAKSSITLTQLERWMEGIYSTNPSCKTHGVSSQWFSWARQREAVRFHAL